MLVTRLARGSQVQEGGRVRAQKDVVLHGSLSSLVTCNLACPCAWRAVTASHCLGGMQGRRVVSVGGLGISIQLRVKLGGTSQPSKQLLPDSHAFATMGVGSLVLAEVLALAPSWPHGVADVQVGVMM